MLLALLIWRVMERAMRRHVETTGPPFTGWDKKATARPTSFMLVPKVAGVIVLKHGHHRQLARPFSVVQQPYLIALDVPSAGFTDDQSRSGEGEDSGTPLPAAQADPALIGRRLPADARQDHEPPPGNGRAGLDDHWALVWWESRIPAAHPRGAEMGRLVCRKW